VEKFEFKVGKSLFFVEFAHLAHPLHMQFEFDSPYSGQTKSRLPSESFEKQNQKENMEQESFMVTKKTKGVALDFTDNIGSSAPVNLQVSIFSLSEPSHDYFIYNRFASSRIASKTSAVRDASPRSVRCRERLQ